MLNQEDQTKKCTKCQIIKSINEFSKDKRHSDGLQSQCIKCSNERSNIWILKNIEQNKNNKNKWYQKNRLQILNLRKIYWLDPNNKKRINQYMINKYLTDSNFKMIVSIRNTIGKILKSAKSKRSLEYIGCTVEELWKHFESKFTPIMTRENYGKVWHIDHIIPISFFNLNDSIERQQCCYWTNLQPMESYENEHIKRNRIDHSSQLCKNLPLCISD